MEGWGQRGRGKEKEKLEKRYGGEERKKDPPPSPPPTVYSNTTSQGIFASTPPGLVLHTLVNPFTFHSSVRTISYSSTYLLTAAPSSPLY